MLPLRFQFLHVTLLTAVSVLVGQGVVHAQEAQETKNVEDAPSVTFTSEDTWKSLSLEQWRFKTGDSLDWADPDYDDSGWRLLRSRTRYDTLRAIGWKGVGWWRIRIIADSSATASADWFPLLFLNQQAGATEAYLNGKLMHRIGRPSGDPALERPINREDVAPMELRPGENLLAVRYSYTDALEIFDFFRGGWPPGLRLRDPSRRAGPRPPACRELVGLGGL